MTRMGENTYVDELLANVRDVVGVRVVRVHVFDGSENSVRIERVIVLPDVILDHLVKELPTNVVIWGKRLIVVCN